MTPRLVVDKVSKKYGRRVLFRRISFDISGGQTLAVTGANGSGKSTLLRILAGVLRPTKGTVHLHLNGAEIAQEERPIQTGLVAPYLNVYDGFTARENLEFIARARRLPNQQNQIDEVLELVTLVARADEYVSTYSSGMKQRIKYAAALLTQPPLLLLDEPSANLDEAGLAMVSRVMERQRNAGRLLIIATNVADEASACDQIVRIEDFL